MISIEIEGFISNTVGVSVHHITWDILTAAESDEQVRKIISSNKVKIKACILLERTSASRNNVGKTVSR